MDIAVIGKWVQNTVTHNVAFVTHFQFDGIVACHNQQAAGFFILKKVLQNALFAV